MNFPIKKPENHRRISPVYSDKTKRSFDRKVELPGLIGIWPSELRTESLEATVRIVALLRKAIRSERQRGRAGHWTYDLNRHLALADALRVEQARLRAAIKAKNKELSGTSL
jgi:hypothetical protein